jgi:hypothetical protein
MLNAAAAAGNFTYGSTTINLLELAARNGQTATLDPTMRQILSDIAAATSGGSIETIDPNLSRFTFNVPVESKRIYPTFRLDYNLNTTHRASFSYNYQKFTDSPDTLNNRDASYPGFPVQAGQESVRLSWSAPVRSVLSSNLVNEARIGYSGAPVTFFGELTTEMFSGSKVPQQGYRSCSEHQRDANQPSPTANPRLEMNSTFEDTLSWLKGSHSITTGVVHA